VNAENEQTFLIDCPAVQLFLPSWMIYCEHYQSAFGTEKAFSFLMRLACAASSARCCSASKSSRWASSSCCRTAISSASACRRRSCDCAKRACSTLSCFSTMALNFCSSLPLAEHYHQRVLPHTRRTQYARYWLGKPFLEDQGVELCGVGRAKEVRVCHVLGRTPVTRCTLTC
jgi:hypothetical protein